MWVMTFTIHRKVEYEIYAANPEDAEATARMSAYDFCKKFAENTANYVSSQFYEHKPKPTIDGAIKVHKTHKHLDYLDSEDDLPLVSMEM
jgi:hypothetical protein